MRKPLSLGVGVVAVAAGFAGASIVAGGSLGAVSGVWHELTGTTRTVTTFTNTNTTSTTPGRGIEVCRWLGRGHRRYSLRFVPQQSLRSDLRGGYRLGPCFLPRPRLPFRPINPGGGGGNSGGGGSGGFGPGGSGGGGSGSFGGNGRGSGGNGGGGGPVQPVVALGGGRHHGFGR
jgi:hypothetical protein